MCERLAAAAAAAVAVIVLVVVVGVSVVVVVVPLREGRCGRWGSSLVVGGGKVLVVGVEVLEALRVAVCREVVRSRAFGVGLVGSASSRLRAFSSGLPVSRGGASVFPSKGVSVIGISSSLAVF